MQDWFKGSLLLAATLSAGIAIGIWYARSHGQAGATVHMDHENVMMRLDHTLRLDSTQHAAIAATLQRHQSHIDSAWKTLRPHVSATLDSTHREIMSALHPRQREAFGKLIEHAHQGGHR